MTRGAKSELSAVVAAHSGEIGKLFKPYLIPTPVTNETYEGVSGHMIAAMRAHREQSFSFDPLPAHIPTTRGTLEELPGKQGYVVAIPSTNEGERWFQIICFSKVLAAEPSGNLAISAVLSLWKCVLGDIYTTSFGVAIEQSGMSVTEVSMDRWIVATDTAEYLEAAVLSGIRKNEYIAASIMAMTFLILSKQLNSNNYLKYKERRIKSFQTKLGIDDDVCKEISDLIPSQTASGFIYRRLGNKIRFRAVALEITQLWDNQPFNNTLRSIADILLSLFAFVDMAHITMIKRYIMDETPAILSCPEARCEAFNVFIAMTRLLQMGKNARYARLLYETRQLPETSRNGMRAIAAFAQELAGRDYPTLSNYAEVDNAAFKGVMDGLRRAHKLARHPVPREHLKFLNEEYAPDESRMVQQALQGGSTEIASIISLFSQENDGAE